MPEMTDQDLCKIVSALVKDCEAYRDEQAADRIKAMEYYNGEMKDTPADDGRSRVVSRDVRGEIKKVLPSILRIILGSDKVVEYEPVEQGDEEMADQATDYINYIAFPESDGPDAVHDAIDDALRLRNGILKWFQEDRIEVEVSEHTGLDDMGLAQLTAGDDVEVLAHSERDEQAVEGPVKLHDVKIRRKVKKSRTKLRAVQRENFLIHPDAVNIADSPVVGENIRLRRSDLVAMGYDRDRVKDLPTASERTGEQEIEEITRRRDVLNDGDEDALAMQEVEYYELLVRIDRDDDGIAELRRLVFAGGLSEKHLFENEEWDEVYYASIVCERRPHQWEGNSVSDDVMDIQRIKTVLLRQTLDNLYWQNNPQPTVQEGVIVNPDAVTNPAFGKPIRVTQGTDARAALAYNQVPFVADKSFAMLNYLDQEKHDRTGISDASSGMAPDALQNMTAKASAMIEQAGIGQTEMMVRTIASSLKPVFKGLLKLIIQHQDKPRTVRLRKQWVEFDPRSWDASMDVTVNTGLGAGTRERDMMMMQIILGLQEKVMAAFGADNPMVKPDQLYNGIAKTVQAAGLKSVDLYFTKPDPAEVEQKKQAAANKPNPEQMKIDGQKEIEQIKGHISIQLADKKMQVDMSKEQAQRDADLVVKQAELEKETEARIQEAQIKAATEASKMQLEREKIASTERIELEKIISQQTLERERMDREDARAEKQYETEIAKAQAASLGKAFEKNEAMETAQ